MHKVRDRLKNTVLLDGIQRMWDIPKSLGSYLCERDTGKVFLDFHTGYGSLPLGWNHPDLVEASYRWTPDILTNKLSNSDFYTDYYLDFVDKFNLLAKPDDFDGGVFFVDTGTLAVDNAIKACFDYRLAGNYDYNNLNPDLEILYLANSFHGRSGFPLSITDAGPVKVGGYPKHKWSYLTLIPIIGDDEIVVNNALYLAEEMMIEKGEKLSGVIIEGGVQCEGGDRHLHPDFCLGLQNLSRKYDLPLVIDEVQTGFWSTGETWGYQRLGLNPDLVAFGKKSGQCGVMAGGVFNNYRDSVFKTSGRINSTWGGNLIDMCRSSTTMDIILQDNLQQNVNRMEELFIDKMTQLSKSYPDIKHPRAQGVIMAFDLPNKDSRDKFISGVEELGLLCLAAGNKTVRFRPSLAVTEAELQGALQIIEMYLKHN